MLADLFKLSLNNLRRRKLRSWLTMLGIFIGIAAVVSLISLGQGLQTAITGQFSSLGAEYLTIQNAGTGFGPPGSTAVEKLNEHDLNLIKGVRGVSEVVPRLIRITKVDYNNAVRFHYVTDIPEDKTTMKIVYGAGNLETETGRLLEIGDQGKVVIGQNIAKKENFGKELSVGKKINIQGKDFEIIGILKKGSSFQINDVILMLNADLKELLDIDDEIDIITVKVEDTENPEDVADRIEKALRRDRNEKLGEEDFSVQTPLEALSSINQILTVINIVVVGIAMISLLVGGIGIANTMYTSVLERKKEIGTMKAVGAKNSDVLLLFLLESGLLGLVGGLIGVAIGSGAALVVEVVANNVFGSEIVSVNLSATLMGFAMGFSFLIGIISGIVPSYQASKLSPVEALRS